MIFAIALSLFYQNTNLTSPAGNEYTKVVPGGKTILPNGRFLTPIGKRLYTGEDLWKVLLSPDEKTVLGFSDDTLTIFTDLQSDKPTKKSISVKDLAPTGSFSKDGKQLLVSMGEDGKLAVYDTETWKPTGEKINLNTDGFKESYAVDVAISPTNPNVAYALDVANQYLVTIDLEKRVVTSRVKAGREPYALVLSPDGSKAFVANIGIFDYSVVKAPEKGKGNPRGLTRPPFGFPGKDSETGIDFEGRQIPGLGDPRVPDAQSIWSYDLRGDKPVLANQAKSGLLIHATSDAGKAIGGSAPNALAVLKEEVFVSNANNDTVQVFSTALKLKRTFKLSPSAAVSKLRGVIPSALTLSKDGKRLYVCESGLNAIAVLDPKTGKALGHIPSGWFPLSLALDSNSHMYVGVQKGIGQGPRGPHGARTETDERYRLAEMPGMVQAFTEPKDSELAGYTKQVLQNNGVLAIGPSPKPKPSDQIKYVVFITKENHTFDGIFGGLKGSNSVAENAEFGLNGWIREKGKGTRLPIMPNHISLAEKFSISDNFYMEPHASGDGHRWLVGVYPSLWTTRLFYAGWDFRRSDTAKGRLVSFGSNGSQIPEDYLENGSLWEHLDRGNVPFRNYGEGFEFPGVDEGPAMARSGAGEPVNFPMPMVLYKNTCFEFPIFNTNIPDIARVDWFKEDIEKNFRAPGKPLPKFINIALCNDHGDGPRPKDGYPYVCSYMADNDLALGKTVEYLSHTPEWKNMAIFVTQDDSGGDNDSVDRHRSFVLCISPWAKKQYVSHRHSSIMSIIKTIYGIFGLGPNNMFDATAASLDDMFTDKPDYTPYTHIEVDPRVFKPEDTLDPTDPGFKRRRLRPSVKMDDPKFFEWLQQRGSGQ